MKLKEYLWIIAIILACVGCFLLTISIYGLFLKEYQPEPIKKTNEFLGNWIYWTFVLGISLTIGSIWYLIDRYRSRKELLSYLETDSKAKFIKNIKRIEELANKLGKKYKERVEEKKREWDIKP